MSDFAEVLDRIKGIAYGDEVHADPEATLDELWDLRCAIGTITSSARKLLAAVDSDIAKLLTGKVARFGDSFVKVAPKRTLEVYNPDGLFDWLGDDARHAFKPEAIRITSLRAIATKRGADPRAIVNSFIDYREDDPVVTVLPLDKAPRYASDMAHGEVKERSTR